MEFKVKYWATRQMKIVLGGWGQPTEQHHPLLQIIHRELGYLFMRRKI